MRKNRKQHKEKLFVKRMLIVEDDEAIRTGLCRSLSSDTLDAVGILLFLFAAGGVTAELSYRMLTKTSLTERIRLEA